MISYLERLSVNFPVASIEDGLDENDWEGWQELTQADRHTDTARGRRSVRHEYPERLAGRGHDRQAGKCRAGKSEPDRNVDRGT